MKLDRANNSSDDFEQPKPKRQSKRSTADADAAGRSKVYRQFIIELKSYGITDDMISEKM